MDDDVLEALASLPTFHHATVSPDGSEVAVYYDETGRNELHVIDVATGERTQWSDGEVPRNARWHVEWGADGERVYFHLDEGGNEQNDIYAIDRDGGVEAVVEFEGQTTLDDVGEDGETLLVGSTATGQMQLYRHDLPSGETTQLTDYERAAYGGLLSPDGDRIAYATNETDTYENMDTYVADADGSDPRNLDIGDTGAEVAPNDWGPEGERLLVTDNSTDLGRCGVYDLRTDEVTWYGGEFEESAAEFLPGGDRFLATRTRECMQEVVVYDVETGAATALDLPPGVASLGRTGSAVVDGEQVVLSHTTPDSRPDLLRYDLTSDGTEPLIEAAYGDLDPEMFVDAEYFTFESAGLAEFEDSETVPPALDGTDSETLEIEALLYDTGERPSPAIVNPHGGPRGQDTRGFDLYTQFLCSQGYSVLKVNYRGSTGRGREFAQAIYDDWGGDEQADIAKGTTILAEKEWVDDDRIAVFGGSYGGYSAYCQTTMYPDLYDAGVAWIGLTDLHDMFENTMPHYRTELLEKNVGSPDEHPDLYDERSPINYADNLAAPLLLVHGVNDRRVPVSQARLFRDRLAELGYQEGEDGDFEYVELGEEGHASTDVDQKIRMFETLADFLDRRL